MERTWIWLADGMLGELRRYIGAGCRIPPDKVRTDGPAVNYLGHLGLVTATPDWFVRATGLGEQVSRLERQHFKR